VSGVGPGAPRSVRLVAALAAAALVLAACGGSDDASEETTTTTTTAPTTTTAAPTTTTAPPPVEPLTGEPLEDDALRTRPAVVVKVDDTSRAVGRQEGLDVADLVYAERIEGGAVRLAAVFHATTPTAGPVRSARTTDLGITGNLNRPLFAYSGANSGVLSLVRGHNLVDMGVDVAGGRYSRRGTGLLRFFVDTAQLLAGAPAGSGPPPQLFAYRPAGAPVTNAGAEPTRAFTVRYAGFAGTTARYIDEGAGWARLQGGVPHTTANGARVSPDNVIVQYVQYRSSGFADAAGSPSPEAVLTGEGDALVFTGGTLVRARWQRADLGATTTYTDVAGQPVLLAPGTTWVELADPGAVTLG
jgi:hypothetical protein